jgi:two-component system NtrC family sensor kinase
LEIKVVERTQQLRQTEAEKINQLYRLAEFGRLSSGIFHDLINPLTAISLNLEQIKDETKNKISSTKSYLGQALLATHKMEGLIAGIKKQIQQESHLMIFSASEEIEQIIQILAYKARRANVSIDFQKKAEIKLYGDAIKFGQIISNLLANAIEASEIYDGQADTNGREVKIILVSRDNTAVISVSDQGQGINSENIKKIFEPFFSTKKESGRGLGLGLASAKNITEKNFSGQIAVSSQLGRGSLFTVTLPLKPIENKSL